MASELEAGVFFLEPGDDTRLWPAKGTELRWPAEVPTTTPAMEVDLPKDVVQAAAANLTALQNELGEDGTHRVLQAIGEIAEQGGEHA